MKLKLYAPSGMLFLDLDDETPNDHEQHVTVTPPKFEVLQNDDIEAIVTKQEMAEKEREEWRKNASTLEETIHHLEEKLSECEAEIKRAKAAQDSAERMQAEAEIERDKWMVSTGVLCTVRGEPNPDGLGRVFFSAVNGMRTYYDGAGQVIAFQDSKANVHYANDEARDLVSELSGHNHVSAEGLFALGTHWKVCSRCNVAYDPSKVERSDDPPAQQETEFDEEAANRLREEALARARERMGQRG